MSGDKAIVGYKEFIELCRVDDRNNFAGYRVEADGLYANVPTNDPALGSDDMAACVPWHPTGHYDKPALPLPCTLGQLRAFLPDAGMSGYIDEGAVDTVLGEREHTTGWYDCTMNAAMWLKRASVKPDEAAMLLWRLNPLERDWQGKPPDPERTFVDGNEASPDYYRALKRAFEDVAETDPKPRTLLDWRDVAKREGLRYHEWIDEYEQARIDELPADAGSKDDAVKVGAGATALAEPKQAAIITTHRLKTRSNPLDAVIDLATKTAVAPDDSQSVYAKMVTLAEAENKPAPLVGYSSEGIQYRGKKYEETGEPDTFTAKNLRDRMARAKAR